MRCAEAIPPGRLEAGKLPTRANILCTLPDKQQYSRNKEGRMPKLTEPELKSQPRQMPSQRMETKKPKSHKRLWLLTGVMVLVLIIVVVAAWQASKSSQSTKTTTQAAHLRVDQAQPWSLAHDTHEPLTANQAQPWSPVHDTHEPLTANQAQPWSPVHDTHEPLTGQ